MHIDHTMITSIAAILMILAVASIMRYFKQPNVVAYIISGIILGPSVMGVLSDTGSLSRLGDFGVVMLLFFLGMELSLDNLIKSWKVGVTAALGQIVLGLLALMALKNYLDWTTSKCLLMAFIVSLSSTAVVIKMLEEWGELETQAGKNIVSILIIQDILIAPMLISINMAAGVKTDVSTLFLQFVGAIGIVALVFHILKNKHVKLPLSRLLKKDHELQVFSALGLCFGLALMTGMMGLSSGLGAFVGGMIVASAKETDWIHHKLESIKVIFVAVFFVSVGMLVNPSFIWNNLGDVSLFLLLVLVVNSLVMTTLLRFLGYPWKESLYVGAVLSQVGEFSFVMAGAGISMSIVTEYSYQLTIAIISLSLLLSPAWIYIIRLVTNDKVSLVQAERDM